MAEEASLEEDGGVLDAGEDTEAGAPDAAIFDVHAIFLKVHAGAPVDGGGEGNVGRVLQVAGFFLEVGGFERAAIVGDAHRREGECFDAPGTGSSTAADGIEVDADEDGVLVFVGDVDPLLEGEEGVAITGHDDLELQFGEVVFKQACDLEIVVGFGAVAVGGAGVAAAVAGVDDDGVKGFGRGDGGGTEDGIDNFQQISDRDVVAASQCDDGIAKDELHIVHEDLLGSGGEPEVDVFILHLNP